MSVFDDPGNPEHYKDFLMGLDVHWKKCLQCGCTFACWGEEFPLCGQCSRDTVGKLVELVKVIAKIAIGDFHFTPTDRCGTISNMVETELAKLKLDKIDG